MALCFALVALDEFMLGRSAVRAGTSLVSTPEKVSYGRRVAETSSEGELW